MLAVLSEDRLINDIGERVITRTGFGNITDREEVPSDRSDDLICGFERICAPHKLVTRYYDKVRAVRSKANRIDRGREFGAGSPRFTKSKELEDLAIINIKKTA